MLSRSPAPWRKDIAPFAFLFEDEEWLSGASSRVEFLVQLPLAMAAAVVSGSIAFVVNSWMGATVGFIFFAFAGLVGASSICTVLTRRAHDMGLSTGAATLFLPPVFGLYAFAGSSTLALYYASTLALALALLPQRSFSKVLPQWAAWPKQKH